MVFRLPNFALDREFLLSAKGKSALEVLNGAFQRDPFRRRQDDMEVVRHDHECVKQKFILAPVGLHNFQKQFELRSVWNSGV